MPAVELVTVGQRRGIGSSRPTSDRAERRRVRRRRDVAAATVTVGPLADSWSHEIAVAEPVLGGAASPEPAEHLEVQISAHGQPVPARWSAERPGGRSPSRSARVAPGQSVVLYRGDAVVGGGLAASPETATLLSQPVGIFDP